MKLLKSLIMATTFTLVAFFYTSCGEESALNVTIPGVDGPKVVLNEENVLVSMVLENVSIEGGLRFAIPKYPNSYLEVSPDFETSGMLVAFSLNLKDVFSAEVSNLDPQRLPGGRALPGVAAGSLPAVAFSIEQLKNVAIYVGPQILGVFVPVDLPFDNTILTSKFYSGDKRIGNLSIVGKDVNGENDGVFLMLNISKKQEKKLKKYIKKK